MPSFAELLRASKFATFDPVIKQVYATPQVCKKVGDWGLKRNLPRTWQAKVITVDGFDTAERQTPFDSALDQLYFKIRFCANFGNTSQESWSGFPANRPRPLGLLPSSEFKALLKEAKARKPEWDAIPITERSKPEDMLRFLNLDSSANFNSTKAPPCYRSTTNEQGPVKGRILNRTNTSVYAVGVNGFIATLSHLDLNGFSTEGPRRHRGQIDVNEFNHELRDFWVQNSSFSGDGIPSVSLTIYNPKDSKQGINISGQVGRLLYALDKTSSGSKQTSRHSPFISNFKSRAIPAGSNNGDPNNQSSRVNRRPISAVDILGSLDQGNARSKSEPDFGSLKNEKIGSDKSKND
ncbi:hypothetical protein DSO57_1000066 [Entomophthora muscae]|uniref:Uncharacterized protein n=1 Tax=Entomophthora muscae TaxID=34485 RepID=A0ACC2SMF0_9FUNG|nr:hypothetical protein DSO57_1000066 [Entomophthora muscae]